MADPATLNLAFMLLILLLLTPIAIAAWRRGLFARGSKADEEAEPIISLPDERGAEPIASDRRDGDRVR